MWIERTAERLAENWDHIPAWVFVFLPGFPKPEDENQYEVEHHEHTWLEQPIWEEPSRTDGDNNVTTT
jgi:hypothetical protein